MKPNASAPLSIKRDAEGKLIGDDLSKMTPAQRQERWERVLSSWYALQWRMGSARLDANPGIEKMQ